MILNRALNEDERRKAQHIYYQFSAMNALALGCSNTTLQSLLALQLGISSTAASVIGPMEYLRYVFLPLGFLLAAHFGVCKGKRITLTLVGILCFVIALSAWVPATCSGMLFFSGVILMGGAMATLWAMEFPLQKNITTSGTFPRMIAISQSISATVGLVTSLILAWYLDAKGGDSLLSLFFCVGAIGFILNGIIISRMPEPSILKKLASKPLWAETRRAWHADVVRKQMFLGYVQNVVLATMLPVNILAAKFATNGNNSKVLILSTVQSLMLIVSSGIFKVFTQRFGPRRLMIATWPAVVAMAAYWCLAPVESSFWYLIPPFILAGFINVGFAASQGSYFTLGVPNELQVGGTVLVYIFHGGLVGLTGIMLNPLLFKLTAHFVAVDTIMQYRAYYLITGIIALFGIIVPIRLPEFFKRK